MDKFEKFQSVTGYDIKTFFQDFVSFANEEYPYIIDYYQGGEMNADAFKKLDVLIKQADIVEPLFTLHQTTLNDISMWELLDNFTEIQTKLLTAKNSVRWFRSAPINNTNTIQLKKQLKTGQTFEDVSRQLDDNNPDDDWLGITIDQSITEEDYTSNGSNIFMVNLKNANNNSVDSVVDSLEGEKILGKDITTRFIFIDNDLETVTSSNAIDQAIKVNLEALKGCIPEFPEYGLPNEFIGTTVNAIQYASLFKSLMNMFQRDSRFTAVELLDVYTDKDAVFMKIMLTVVTNETYLANVKI